MSTKQLMGSTVQHLFNHIAIGIIILVGSAGFTTAHAHAETVVRVVAPTVATQNPGGGKVVRRLGTTTPYGHNQLQLRVFKSVPGEPATNGTPRKYYLVHLPYRRTALDSSHGHRGWVSSDKVTPVFTPYHVYIMRGNRTLTLKRNGNVWRKWKVVVGRSPTPTPRGEYAVYGKTNANHGFAGTGIMPFAYSSVHTQFDGGPGMVAMHGRAGASLATPLGTAGSNGCVRMTNRNMETLLSKLPIGTPVTVR